MKQLDIDVSPPANIMTFRPRLINVTFDPDPWCNAFGDMNYCPVLFVHSQTDGRTNRQTESDAYEPTMQVAQVGSIILCG